MIRSLLTLFRTVAEPRRLLLFGLMAGLALVAGFFSVSSRQAAGLIREWGYYYLLGVFVLFVVYAWRLASARPEVWRTWLRRPGWPGAVILAATAFAVWGDPFKHKILFDEFVLQGTALQMHATKEIATVIRAYDIGGSWTSIDSFLDKRPYFFTFLVSLVHDLTGYRIANMFLVNVALTPVLFALVYWIGHAFTGRRGPALLAVGLLATMPLLGQNSSGAGLELHNLVMIALVIALALLWLRAPDPDRLSLLVLGTVLLAQCRYESVLFVGSVAIVIVAGWLRAGRIFWSWPALLAPLFLVPRVWHQRFLDASPLLWQLHEGETSRFDVRYLAGNLEGAWKFFFHFGSTLPNSWYLSVVGCGGLAWGLVCTWRWLRTPGARSIAPVTLVLVAFGGAVAANLAMLMFYYWSRLDDVIASRFALPMCLMLAWLAAWLVGELERRQWPALRLAALGLGVWVLGWGVPATARRLYTNQNLVMQEVEWEHDELLNRPGSRLFVSNKSTLPFVLWRIPTLINGVARQRGEQIAYHLKERTFDEVIVAQALRPTSEQGDLGVDPEDLMPEGFHLQPIAQKRFGGRIARLSRVVSIDPPAVEDPAADPSAVPFAGSP